MGSAPALNQAAYHSKWYSHVNIPSLKDLRFSKLTQAEDELVKKRCRMLFAVTEAPVPTFELITLTGFLAVGLALVHVLAGHLRFLHIVPRSRWLSAGGGVSVAYVFVHVLPDLSEAQETIQQNLHPELRFLEHHVYMVALVGLAVFYGLERTAKISRQRSQAVGKGDVTSPGVFWLHIGSFAAYNTLIGYLLVHREVPGLVSLFMFAIAMALHFLVNDDGLREHHKKMYDTKGRWILAAAIIAGWVLGSSIDLSAAAIAVLFAFLSGGVMLNVLKEELPEERESRFWAFAAGAGAYTVLLLLL